MAKFIVGVKKGMAQVFDAGGRVHPVTVITVPTNAVTQVKTAEGKDGYAAVQLGIGERKAKNVNKAQATKGFFAKFKEFRLADVSGLEKGAAIAAGTFEAGDSVVVSGISKGKGFQGVVKRHGFHGGRRTHGQKHSEREAGSIGGGPGRAGGRVVKGMRMAGRMGGDRVTVKGLTVVKVDTEKGELYIRGAVPGRRGSYVEVRGDSK
jgi:large subunit ribosomal protein L3